MKLTDTAIRNAKARSKPRKMADGGGLTLLVNSDGSKWWRFRYRIDGREQMLSLGVYPDVTLQLARQKRDDARKLLAGGGDPAAQRRAQRVASGHTFEAIALEFMESKRKKLTASTWHRDITQLQTMVFPYVGRKPIGSVEATDLLSLLRRIEGRGAHDTAHRARALCGRIFRFAISTGRAKHNVAADLYGALAPKVEKSYAAIVEPAKVGALMRAIDGYDGHPTVCAALKLSPLLFVRPGELRAAEWSEFDLNRAEWRIPPERMKMRELHIVPLATQAVAILKEVQLLTGRGRYVFPAIGYRDRCLSENTIAAALRRLGYTKEEMTAHGFRTTASTLLNEMDIHPDVIELQLAHMERNEVRAAYNRAQKLEARRKMMQTWADYLDELKVAEEAKAA